MRGYGVMGVLSWGGLVTPKFSAPLAAKLCVRPPSFTGARTCSGSSIIMPSSVGLGFHPPPERPKNVEFFCLSVRYAFDRQRLCTRFRHEGVGLQKRFWYLLIGEGLYLWTYRMFNFVSLWPIGDNTKCRNPKNRKIRKNWRFFAATERQNKPIDTKFGT